MSKHFFGGFGAGRKRSIRAEEGFSLVMALLVVLLGLFSTLAIAGRTLSSREKDNEYGQGQSARDAAEIGMTRIIADLNRPRNRRLLVNAPTLSTATVTGIEGDQDLISPCDSVNGAAPDLTSAETFNSGNLLNNEVTIPNSTLRYTLVAISNGTNSNEQDALGNANSTFNVTVGAPGPPGTAGISGTITLDVRGLLYHNGVEAGRYNLRKTYAVIPKCCGSSFGGFTGSSTTASLWGNDSSTCGISSGYGLIVGAQRGNSTVASERGQFSANWAVQLQRTVGGATTNTPINRVYCTIRSPYPLDNSSCPFSISGLTIVQTRLAWRDISLPEVPYPVSAAGTYGNRTSPTATLVGLLPANRAGGGNYPSAFLNTTGCTTGNTCSVQEFARMRVCDNTTTTNAAWPSASTRAGSTATLNNSNPLVGCRITVTNSELLETNNFDNWKNASGDTLKWHLGRLCVRETDWGSLGKTVIYCNLDRLIIRPPLSLFSPPTKIVFNTAGAAANTSVPIIISLTANGTILNSANSLFLGRAELQQTNSQRASGPILNDLTVYGCAVSQATCSSQSITTGTLSVLGLTDVFVYAPYAIMSSTAAAIVFRGAYWGNRITSTASGSSFTIPSGNVQPVVEGFPTWTPSQLDREVDFVARNVISVSSF
jgi:hypothetical protein